MPKIAARQEKLAEVAPPPEPVVVRESATPPFVVEAVPEPKGWPSGLSITLEKPATNMATNAMTVEVQGFVVRKKNCLETRPATLEFLKGETSLWSTKIHLARPDVVDYFKDIVDADEVNCGFNTMLPSFLSTTTDPIRLQVVHEPDVIGEQRRYTLATINFKPVGKSEFQPSEAIGLVTVNSLGRSGSSLLCRVLDAHPQCVAPQLHEQYGEVFVLGHFLRLAAVLSSEGCMSNLNKLETEADFEFMPAGYLKMDGEPSRAFHASLMRTVTRHAADIVHDVHEEIANYARSIKPQARFWVEKTWNQTSANLAPVMIKTAREIILIRDVRDFWRSQALYMEKIKAPEAAIAEHARATFGKYVAIATSYLERSDETLLVKYEELLEDPETEFRRVTAHLGLPFTKEFGEAVASIVGVDDKHSRGLSTAELEYDGPDFYEYLSKRDERAVEYLKDLLARLGYEI